jgi:hypothetical protein
MTKVFDLSKFKSTKQPTPQPASPKARRRSADPFVMVPLKWIERAAGLAHSPATLVLMELLHASWRTKSATFPLPSVRLKQLGVSRHLKRRVLLDLECGGIITVRRLPRRGTIVTLNEV